MKNLGVYAVLILGMAISNNAWSEKTDKPSSDNSDSVIHSVQTSEQSELVEKKKKLKKEKKICKNSAPTGSRIGKKTCLTKAAWDEMSRNARNSLDSSTKPTSNNRKGE